MYTRKIPYICIGYIFPIFGEYMSLIETFRENMSAKFLIEKHLFQLRNVDSYYDNFSRETVQFKITSLD